MKPVNETKRGFFEKINKTYKPLARLTKKKERGHKLLIPEIKEGSSLLSPWTLKG